MIGADSTRAPLSRRISRGAVSAAFVHLYVLCTVLAGLAAAASVIGCGAGASGRPTSNEELAAMSADDRPDGTGGAAAAGANCDFGGNHDRTCRAGLTCCYGPEYERTGYGACRDECPAP
jgi:hypothetical protein